MAKKKDIDLILSQLEVSPNLDSINSKCNIVGNNNKPSNKILRLRPITLSLCIILVLIIIINGTIIMLNHINKKSLDDPNSLVNKVAFTEYEVVDTIFNDEVIISPDMEYKKDNNMQIAVVEIGKDTLGNIIYTNRKIEVVKNVFMETQYNYKVICLSGTLIKYDKIQDEWEVIK